MKSTLSPGELAEAIGVSESSIKRWADDGLVQAQRTAGGHRRILLSEAIRFVRTSGTPLVKPEILDLPDLVPRAGAGDGADRLFEHLRAGARHEARSLLLALFLRGTSMAQLIDGPVRVAMSRIGELWQHETPGVFWEHRATDICIHALSHLRTLIPPPPPEAPRALGGAPRRDPYLLPSMAVATVLADEGFQAVNLGPDCPTSALQQATEHLEPRLVWLSVSVAEDPIGLAAEIETLSRTVEGVGGSLLIGGNRLRQLELPRSPTLFTGSSMTEMVTLARGLRPPGG